MLSEPSLLKRLTRLHKAIKLLSFVQSYKSTPKNAVKLDSVKLQKQQHTASPNNAKQKYFAIYSINTSLYYNTQQFCLCVSAIQKNSSNYFYYTKNLRTQSTEERTCHIEN